ncbi:MAG: hypothetical protein WBD47_11420, partial [Phormidesmis sp.]
AQAEKTAEETAEATEKAPTDTPSEQPKAVEDPITPSQLAAKLTGPAVDIEKFWQYDASLDPSLVVITPAEQTVLDVIGELPLASTEAQIIAEHFKTLYQAVAQQAMMTALS